MWAQDEFTFGYYMQVFHAPLAVLRLLQSLRRFEPAAPVFVLSDAGLDFGPMAQRYGAWFAHAGKSQCRDHSRQPAEHFRTAPKATALAGNYGDELRYLKRIGSAMALCACSFIVVLEEDMCVHKAPTAMPPGDVGGVPWPDYSGVPRFEAMLQERAATVGYTRPPPFGRVWGCAGGCYYRVGALGALPEVRRGEPSAAWRMVLRTSPAALNAVDMAAPTLIHMLGGRVIPWSEVREGRRTFAQSRRRPLSLSPRAPANATAFEHKCKAALSLRRRPLPPEQAWLAPALDVQALHVLAEDGRWTPPAAQPRQANHSHAGGNNCSTSGIESLDARGAACRI